MNTQEYIRKHGLQALNDNLGIGICYGDNNLVCLDYSQKESPKFHPVVQECRGLILQKDTLEIVYRCMTRFYNYNESKTDIPVFIGDDNDKKLTLQEMFTADDNDNNDEIEQNDKKDNNSNEKKDKPIKYHRISYFCDKIDGTLIKIYYFNGNWYVGTRGTVIANNIINTTSKTLVTFYDLVFKALNIKTNDEFQIKCNLYLNPDYSYICELTSAETRVVTQYFDYTLYFLCVRNTFTGEYISIIDNNGENNENNENNENSDNNTNNTKIDNKPIKLINLKLFGMKPLPKLYFSTEKDVLNFINSDEKNKELFEGLVAYDVNNIPLFKYKSLHYIKIKYMKRFLKI
jgi:hypothetical protein